jgi:rod shape-determining protein MreD
VKWARDALLFLAVLVLQSTVLYRVEIASIRPDLLVAYVVYIAWMRGPVPGTIVGFSVGLLQDLDAPGPLGLNALAKSVVGFLVAKAGFRVHRSNVGVRFAFFFIATVVHDVIYFGAITGGDLGDFMRQMVSVGLPTALYTAVVAILLLQIAEAVVKRPLLTDEV